MSDERYDWSSDYSDYFDEPVPEVQRERESPKKGGDSGVSQERSKSERRIALHKPPASKIAKGLAKSATAKRVRPGAVKAQKREKGWNSELYDPAQIQDYRNRSMAGNVLGQALARAKKKNGAFPNQS